MKKLIFFCIVSFVILILGSIFIELIKHDAGYILVSVGGWTLESSFWVGTLIFVMGLSLAVFFLWLVIYMIKSVQRRVIKVQTRRDRSASKRTQKGLIHYIEGNWVDAKRELLGAAKKTDLPLVHYLAAARSAHELGLTDESHFLLQQAEKISPENELAIALSQARMQLTNKDFERCLATLQKVKGKAEDNPVVLDLLRQVYKALNDWQALSTLLPKLKKNKILDSGQLSELEVLIYLSLLKNSFEQAKPEDKEAALTEAWSSMPKALKKNGQLVWVYADYLNQINAVDKAESLVRNALNYEWHDELLILYSQFEGANNKARLVVAEAWLRDHPGDASLLRVLGKISKDNQLWGKAKTYFEDSLKLKQDPITYLDFANLLSDLGEYQKSAQLYKKGLMLRV